MGSSLGFVWMVRDMIRKVLVPIQQELHIACLFVYSLVYISYVFSVACSSFRCVCFLWFYGCHHVSWNIKHQSHVSDLVCINLFGSLGMMMLFKLPKFNGSVVVCETWELGRFLKKCLQKNSGGCQVSGVFFHFFLMMKSQWCKQKHLVGWSSTEVWSVGERMRGRCAPTGNSWLRFFRRGAAGGTVAFFSSKSVWVTCWMKWWSSDIYTWIRLMFTSLEMWFQGT